MYAKKWYESKTFWLNLTVIVLAIVAYVLQGISDGQLQIPGVSAEAVAFWLGVVNLAMRFVTNKPVKL